MANSRIGLVLLIALVVPSCWRTRLTEPKEALLYYDEYGDPKNPAIVIRAPDYMAILRRLRAESGEAAIDEYKIKPSVRLRIEVVGVPDLDRTIDVSPNGKISLPLIGELRVEGKTLSAIHTELEVMYSRYYEDPQVTVNAVSTSLTASEFSSIAQAGTVSVFSIAGRLNQNTFGQFRAGGTVKLRGDENVMEILSKTQALHGESNWTQIAVIREPEEGLRGVIIVDVSRFLEFGAVDENIPVKSGDVIFIPIERNTWVEELVANIRVLGTVATVAGEVANFIRVSEDL
ncbi:MAG: polysaccharide biosynthesis/export family protein [Planctomycetota bacterium]|nr:polysaccharide biosynthesis/export family protein [Planctomycetota bacterium]